jgi:hypothetical protein
MFDQLTDYNENEEENNENDWKRRRSDRGEDESEEYDRGEDGDATNLHEYRQRIAVIN